MKINRSYKTDKKMNNYINQISIPIAKRNLLCLKLKLTYYLFYGIPQGSLLVLI